jgi:hypothetical protein
VVVFPAVPTGCATGAAGCATGPAGADGDDGVCAIAADAVLSRNSRTKEVNVFIASILY